LRGNLAPCCQRIVSIAKIYGISFANSRKTFPKLHIPTKALSAALGIWPAIRTFKNRVGVPTPPQPLSIRAGRNSLEDNHARAISTGAGPRHLAEDDREFPRLARKLTARALHPVEYSK
jgi:hypothetical protein